MSQKHFWSQVTTDYLGGEIGITNFTCDTTCTGLVAKPGHKLRILDITVCSDSAAEPEGIGDSIFQDGA